MNMHKPLHPGELFTNWLDDLGVSVPSILAVTAAA
jgi:plasmid maintenance system antidote protein VapI